MTRSIHTTAAAILSSGLALLLSSVLDAHPVATASPMSAHAPTPSSGRAGRPAPVHGPHVHGNRTEPTYDYASAIRESVRVTTPTDSDHDGRKDTVVVDIVRPREAAEAGVDVPVIMVASPYFTAVGRGPEGEKKTYDAEGNLVKMPLFYDNYFVPRGYAVASMDLLGTARSSGCGDLGGPAEIASVTSVISWFNGRARGTTLDGRPVQATWSTGDVGMIGKSYDGTVANGAAATGVRGLRTIVPIAAISSWYDYVRYEGIVTATTYPGYLARFVGNNNDECADEFAAMDAAADDATGSYNAFWAARDHVKDAGRVRASVLLAHGQEDLNVMPVHAGRWWQALGRAGVPRRLWLGRVEHTDPFDARRAAWVETLHSWFDYWLQGLDTDAMSPRAEVEPVVDTWTTGSCWPVGTTVPVPLGPDTLGVPSAKTVRLTDAAFETEDAIVGDPTTERVGRQVFLSAPLPGDVRLGGSPTVRLRIRSDKPGTHLSARIVDYSTATRYVRNAPLATESCWGASTAVDDGCYRDRAGTSASTDYGIVGRGWLDAAHRRSLTRPTPLPVGRWTDVTVPLMATDAVIRKGARVGLVVTLSDGTLSPELSGATVDIALGRSRLLVPAALAGAITPATEGTHVETRRPPAPATPSTDRRLPR